MIVRPLVIPASNSQQVYTFVHLTDPHHRSPSFDQRLFQECRRRVLKDKNAYLILGGDWTDDDRPSTRARRRAMCDGRPEVLKNDDANEMSWLDSHIVPMYRDLAAGPHPKLICALDGDHYRILGGQTTAQYICRRLKVPQVYMGERVAYVAATFDAGHKHVLRYNILVRHGVGGTSSNGAAVNAMERQGFGWDFDLHCAGHSHRAHAHVEKWCKGPNKTGTDVKWGFRAQIRGSSLLQGYEVGKTHYPEKEEYRPLTTGWAECRVTVGKTLACGELTVKMVEASVVAG